MCTAGPEPMYPSFWKLYLDDFPFFGSSLAHLETELELFEVWEIMVRQIIITIITKFQTALARFLDELEGNQKKGKSSKYNFQNDGYIGSGPAVHI